jgi:hypothetical protein
MTRCHLGLIGNHLWGRQIAKALTASGACLRACAGPPELGAWAATTNPHVEVFADASSVITHPEVDLLIVADDLPYRSQLLSEAVQLERNILVVHPADTQPEFFYVIQLAYQERRFSLWPVLPHRFSEGCRKVMAWLNSLRRSQSWHLEATVPLFASSITAGGVPAPLASRSEPLFGESHPLWFWADWLRLLGGEVAEVYAIGDPTGLVAADCSLTLTGRWERGGDFVMRFAPGLAEGFCLQVGDARLEWHGPTVVPGEVSLHWQVGPRAESCQICENTVWERLARWILGGETEEVPAPTWDDAVKCAELVHAVADSLRSRKTVPLLHQDYSEPAVFKSRAATLGCGALWLVLGLVLLAPLFPQVLYLVPIVLACCLAMFLLGWLAYRRSD